MIQVVVVFFFQCSVKHNLCAFSQKNAVVEWKFSRTQMWLEWINKGNSVPVPFNIPYVVLRLFFWFWCGCLESLKWNVSNAKWYEINFKLHHPYFSLLLMIQMKILWRLILAPSVWAYRDRLVHLASWNSLSNHLEHALRRAYLAKSSTLI